MKKAFKLMGIDTTLVMTPMESMLTVVQAPALSRGKETSYLIASKQDEWPDDFEQEIEAVGGEVETAMEAAGIVSASWDDPDFLSKMKEEEYVLAYEVELEVYPQGADGTVIRQPDWNAPNQTGLDLQWDVQRVANNIQSYAISRGDPDTVVGIIDTG
jgi:hypothetical protein